MRALERRGAERDQAAARSTSTARSPRVLHDLGFPPRRGKFIFIIGRVAGSTAEVAEEYAREKPMRIRIPVEYDGEPPRRTRLRGHPRTKD